MSLRSEYLNFKLLFDESGTEDHSEYLQKFLRQVKEKFLETFNKGATVTIFNTPRYLLSQSNLSQI
jgi:hypothetical protein